MHADDVGAADGELDMEVDEVAQRPVGSVSGVDDAAPAREQIVAGAQEDGAEQGALAVEVAVDGGTGDADGGAEVFQAHTVETVLGEEAGGGLQQGVGALGLGSLTRGARCRRTRCHSS